MAITLLTPEEMAGYSSEEYAKASEIAWARERFERYLSYVHGLTLRPYQVPWVEALQALYERRLVGPDGKRRNKLSILTPPNSGKTRLVTAYVEWVIGREYEKGADPEIGLVAHKDQTAWDRGDGIRGTIENNERYHEVFPWVKPDKKKWGREAFAVIRHNVGSIYPTVQPVGITTGSMGARMNTLKVLDDPLHWRQASSDIDKEAAWDVFLHEIRPRGLLEATPEMLISTRVAADDFWGRFEESEREEWVLIHQQAHQPNGSTLYQEVDSHGDTVAGWSVEYLEQVARTDPITYLTQLQAEPPSTIGKLFREFEEVETPPISEVQRVIWCWDTAQTETKKADYSAGGEFWVLSNRTLFLNSVREVKMTTLKLAEFAVKMAVESEKMTGKPVLVLAEKKLNGAAFAEAVRAGGVSSRALDIPRQKLVDRAQTVVHRFEGGQVRLPRESSAWKQRYIQQLRSYPGSPNDDQVSFTVLMLEYFFSRQVAPLPQVRTTWGRWL